ncbi:MAG: hypothetical protein HYR84_04210 [Planctomycetes bacterium]|nr:hypothetical protein [Planctomycetota bacterium]
MVRVLLAGLVGGILVFGAGAFNHMMLDLEGRAFQQFAKDDEVRAFITKQDLKPGLYRFPGIADGFDKMSGDDRTKEMERFSKRYKEGPSGLVVIAPTGEEPMGPQQLIAEFVTNVLAALIAAWIVANTSVGTSYFIRWVVVLNLGLFTWLCTSASYGIWYRFPVAFIQDGLFGSLIEWGVAGLAIAAIASQPDEPPPAEPTAPPAPTT